MSAGPLDTGAGSRPSDAQPHPEAPFRYGAVFLIILTLVVFEIVAPSGDWERAVGLALAGSALMVAVATWRTRERRQLQLGFLIAFAVAVAVIVLAAATGAASPAFVAAASTVIVLAIPITLTRGLLRLVGERGATPHAIAGALSIYLMLGLLFASVISFIDEVRSRPYFVQGADVTNGERVYYSFTVLTSTGFGDYSAALPVGHALAVLQMLAGVLYL